MVSTTGLSAGRLLVICGLLAVSILLVDLFMPLGVVAGVFYMAVIALTARIPSQSPTAYLAVTCTILMVIGQIVVPIGGSALVTLGSVLVSLLVIWIPTLLITRGKWTRASIQSSHSRDEAEHMSAIEWERNVLHTLMEAWPDLVFVKDTKSRFLAANLETAAILGVESPADVVGRTDFDFHSPAYAADFFEVEQDLIRTGNSIQAREETFHKNGVTTTMSTTKVPLMKEGQALGLVCISRDITATKLAEFELMEARDVAEQASNAKSAFLANMSHELRTPLNAIIGFSEIIAEQALGPVGNAKYIDYCRDIRDAGKQLLAEINSILDISKVESGVDEVIEEEISAEEIGRAVIRQLEVRARDCGVTLNMEFPGEPVALMADERKVRQILTNLVTNAVKFTAEGGTVTLRITCSPEQGHILQVIDDGIGIAPEDMDTAFSLFGQIDSNLGRKHAGTGLGLPLVRTLVELHGGSFDLESEVGKGTTATVRLTPERIVPCLTATAS